MNLLQYIGKLMRTEDFFFQFDSAREKLQAAADPALESYWCASHFLPQFEAKRSSITIFCPNGRFCYVPTGLVDDIRFIEENYGDKNKLKFSKQP